MSPNVSAPVLAGDLRVIPLPDILLLLNTNHKTGTLRCLAAGATKTIEWEKGDIVFARSTMPGDRLGAFLLVYSLFHWKEGLFEFREGPPSGEKIALDISVMNLIMEGTRRLDEWSRVKEKIHNDRVILAPVKSADELARQVKLSDFERTVLGLVDGRRAVREIVAVAGRAEFETWQALHALLSAGVIRIQLLSFDPAEAAADPPAAARTEDDADLEKAIDQYGGAVTLLLARAATVGPDETARLRLRLRDATFERAELLREMAIDPDGRIDRRVLLANVADFPPGERAHALQGALERLLRLLMEELKGKVSVDDVAAALEPED